MYAEEKPPHGACPSQTQIGRNYKIFTVGSRGEAEIPFLLCLGEEKGGEGIKLKKMSSHLPWRKNACEKLISQRGRNA